MAVVAVSVGATSGSVTSPWGIMVAGAASEGAAAVSRWAWGTTALAAIGTRVGSLADARG